MKIKDLYDLERLNEMCSMLLNRGIDDEFYDYFMLKDLSWLLENEEKITNDFENNIEKMRWDILLNCKIINDIYGYEALDSLLKDGVEKLSKYLNNEYYDKADEVYNKLTNTKDDYLKMAYFKIVKMHN